MEQATDRTIHVVCAADVNYGRYAGITFASVLASNQNQGIHLHLFSDGVAPKDIDRMQAMAHKSSAGFSVYDLKDRLDSILQLPKKINHYTRTAYARLFIPEFLSDTVKEAVYLDCDIVCITRWCDLCPADQPVPLVGDVRDAWVDLDHRHKADLGLAREATYHNAGVLLINVKAWRDGNVGERLIHALSHSAPTKHGDQDLLNAILWREITTLPDRWNVLISHPNPEEVARLTKTAYNLHFCGGLKPWHFGYRLLVGTGSDAFRRAKRMSPWRWASPDFQLKRLRRKFDMRRASGIQLTPT